MSKTPPPYVEGHGLLAGKTVLVTAAAGQGIGFATAKKCIEEGARVMISDIHERRLGAAAESLTKQHHRSPLLTISHGRKLARTHGAISHSVDG